MTAENRRFVTPSEVIGFDIQCKNSECGVRTSFPLASQKGIPAQCPHCGTLWFEQSGERDNSIRNLAKALVNLKAEGATAGMAFFIEISAKDN